MNNKETITYDHFLSWWEDVETGHSRQCPIKHGGVLNVTLSYKSPRPLCKLYCRVQPQRPQGIYTAVKLPNYTSRDRARHSRHPFSIFASNFSSFASNFSSWASNFSANTIFVQVPYICRLVWLARSLYARISNILDKPDLIFRIARWRQYTNINKLSKHFGH